jgi:hypothetical protein
MAAGSILCTSALALNLLAPAVGLVARDARAAIDSRPSVFRTDQLSTRQLRLWNAIAKVVLAADRQGRPLHPTLDRLWRAVEQSSCVVVIGLVTDKEKASNVAGECAVEKLDMNGQGHIFRLTLYIPSIDHAYAQQQLPQDGLEFIPFSGLKGKRRYAKVLGHELAHIAQAVNDPDYLRLLYEICTEQRSIAAGVGQDGKKLSGAVLQERWNQVWQMVLDSEKPALAAEAQIWRELLAAKKQ